jgi:hypothetical protein
VLMQQVWALSRLPWGFSCIQGMLAQFTAIQLQSTRCLLLLLMCVCVCAPDLLCSWPCRWAPAAAPRRG